MARCLVTGHKGYIGSRLYQKLIEDGHEVLGIDLREKISSDVRTVLREDSEGMFHPHYYNFRPEYIFHLACIPRVGYGLQFPVKTMMNNVIAGTILLNFARKVGSVKRVIYSSSSSIAGNGEGPTTPYALQKYTTEQECKIYSEVYGLDTVSLRYFNVYSEDQTAEGSYPTAISNWMEYVRKGKAPFITGDGEQRRDMVHLDDAVSANIHVMNIAEALGGRIMDVGTGNNISLNEVRKILEKYHKVDFEFRPPRLGEVVVTKANPLPMASLGWKHSVSIEEGIDSCFRSIK